MGCGANLFTKRFAPLSDLLQHFAGLAELDLGPLFLGVVERPVALGQKGQAAFAVKRQLGAVLLLDPSLLTRLKVPFPLIPLSVVHLLILKFDLLIGLVQ